MKDPSKALGAFAKTMSIMLKDPSKLGWVFNPSKEDDRAPGESEGGGPCGKAVEKYCFEEAESTGEVSRPSPHLLAAIVIISGSRMYTEYAFLFVLG